MPNQVRLDLGVGIVFPSILISHKQFRIDACPIEINSPVEVGTGGDAGAADGADNVPFAHHIPLLDTDRVQVHLDGGQTLAVVDDDGIAMDMEAV